jgi:hypothetical protein
MTLADWLVEMGKDPELAEQFCDDPESAPLPASLTEEERSAVLSRNAERIREALNAAASRRRAVLS